MRRPFEIYILYVFQLILAINGLVAGVMLALKPDGSLLQMDPSFLDGSPFGSFLVPGLLLFVFNGLLPLLCLAGSVWRFRMKGVEWLNLYPEKHWSWALTLYSGFGTLIWIVVQQLMTQYFILQPIIMIFGILILVLNLLPRIARYQMIQT
jgi:hypothetical protein